MYTNDITNTCRDCGYKSDYREFVVADYPSMITRCQNASACKKRQKRNAWIAELSQPQQKPHPVDRFSQISIIICTAIMLAIIGVGLAYIWFGI